MKGDKSSRPLRETDLYEPIRELLVSQGYTVRAEVAGYDILAHEEAQLRGLASNESESALAIANFLFVV